MVGNGGRIRIAGLLEETFIVFTACSASPLLCGKCGLDVTWLKLQSCANFWKDLDANCDPLSERNTGGTHEKTDLKIDLKYSITASDDIFVSLATSKYVEK